MESRSRKFIADFEKQCIKKISEKKNFENLTEEEIKEKINKLKKNCFLLQLKNEVCERYLKRHDFGALRELHKFLKKEFSKTSIEDSLFEQDEKTTALKSKEFLDHATEIPDSTERENIGFFIKVVEQEITELCLKSKALKKVYDKKVVYLTGEMESYSTQFEILEKIYNSMNEQYPDDIKYTATDRRVKIAEFVKFMEKLVQNVKVQIRKTSIAANEIKQEYTKICRYEYIEDHPVSSSDIKLLELENEKLRIELSKENQTYMDITNLRENHELKLKNLKSGLSELKETKQKLESDLNSYQKRLLSLNKYGQSLSDEVIQLEAEKKRLIQLRRFAFEVPTPKQYIEEYEKYKKRLKEKKSLKKV